MLPDTFVQIPDWQVSSEVRSAVMAVPSSAVCVGAVPVVADVHAEPATLIGSDAVD